MEVRIARLLACAGFSILVLALPVDAISPDPDGPAHRGRAALDRDLESSHDSLPSFHFLLRYPKGVPEEAAQLVLEVLESEFQRLRVWIPIEAGYRSSPLEVLLFFADDFEEAYGPEVIGLYDGRLRIPIVRSGGETGILTSTLTHELVHALVTEHAGYGVPFWLQEGLAQYLELHHTFPDRHLLAETDPLPLPLLDEILTQSADPVLLERAYRESAWAVHHLAAHYGISGIRRLLGAYAAGRGDPSAFREAIELSDLDFERGLRNWYGDDAPSPAAGNVTVSMEEEPPDPAEIDDWYRYYEDRVRPVKSSLRRVVEALRGGDSAPLAESCPDLTDELNLIFGDPFFFDCPHEGVCFELFEAFRHFEELALSCEAGQTDRMRAELGAAERSLALTANLLEPYGLEP